MCMLQVVSRLLDAGASTNMAEACGATPLIIACRQGHAEVVAALLSAGTCADARAGDGATPLYVASYEGLMNSLP